MTDSSVVLLFYGFCHSIIEGRVALVSVRLSQRLLIASKIWFIGVLTLSSSWSAASHNEPLDALPLEELRLYAEIFEYIKTRYVEPVTNTTLITASIRNMLTQLDPHARYFPNMDTYQQYINQKHGQFGGLGIEIGSEKDNSLRVIKSIDNTPAQQAGIKSGDIIVKINDKTVSDLSFEKAIQCIRGKPGTPITLTIKRAQINTPLTITTIRSIIPIKSVRFKLLEKNYGYVRLTQFNSNTHKDLVKAINRIYQQNKGPLKGLIMDLRNNPGGIMSAAVGVASVFLPKKTLIVYTKGRLVNKTAEFYASPKDYGISSAFQQDPNNLLPATIKSVPLIILINSASASASEIVVGALQDYKRAYIIGTQSFGKGLVQSTFRLHNGGGIKLTTAYYFTPNHRSIQIQGITPDRVVPDKSNTFETEEQYHRREVDLNNHLANPNNTQELQSVETDTAAEKSKIVPAGSLATPKPSLPDVKPDPLQDYQLNQALVILKEMGL